MTNMSIQDLGKQRDSLKSIQNDINNKDHKQSTHIPVLNMSQQQQFYNSTKNRDFLMKDILSVSTNLIGCLVKVTLKNGTCFKGTLFNCINVGKLQLTLTMVEEINNGETVGQIKNALNLYGHEIINIQTLNPENQLNTPSYSKDINFHTQSDRYHTHITNEILDETSNSMQEMNQVIKNINIPNNESRKKYINPSINRVNNNNNNNNNNKDKVINIIKEKENLYRNNHYEKNDRRNSNTNNKRPTKYNQNNSNESFQQGNDFNKQTNKMQRRFNNNHQDNHHYQQTVNKINNIKKSSNQIEMNTSTSFRKNSKPEKKKSNLKNEIQPYRYMMNNNNNNNKKIYHPINNNDIPLINQVSYHHSTIPSFPSYPSSPYCIQWYSPINNSNNNIIMVDQLSLNGINQQQQVNKIIENGKMESNKKDVNRTTETNTSQKKSSISNFKFNTKAAEFKPNDHYHHILLNASDKLNVKNDNDESKKNSNEKLSLIKNNCHHLFIKDVYNSPFSKLNFLTPNQVDPFWSYGKYSYILEYQPPLVYAVQDYQGFIHFIYPYCPYNIINTQQGFSNKSYPMIQNNESKQT